MKTLCLDIGDKRIGVAVSDLLGSFAHGLATVERKKDWGEMDDFRKMIQENEITKIVVGLPLQMNGAEGIQAGKVRNYVSHLEQVFPAIPIVFWDERLSTVGAERTLLEADLSRQRRKEVIDKMAAVFILQGYLDSQRGPSS